MNNIIAKPNLLKQVNLSQIRAILAHNKTATRAEIAVETGISSTTVRALLCEMLENGEAESIGYDESSGGRKAERYALCPNRYYGAAFCCKDETVHALIVNLRGSIVETTNITVSTGQYEDAIITFLDKKVKQYELKAIGLGIPGIVEGGSYWKKKLDSDEFYMVDTGNLLATRYKVPVILENDLNAAAIGFGRSYEKFALEINACTTNMAYIHFEKGCVSAGLLAGGRIIRGHNCFAGELGLIPVEDGQLLDDIMGRAMSDSVYVKWLVRILSWVCGVLNPQFIALGGSQLREHCIKDIENHLLKILPKNMSTEILYAPELWHDYHEGMAYLTSIKIFDTVQLIKE